MPKLVTLYRDHEPVATHTRQTCPGAHSTMQVM